MRFVIYTTNGCEVFNMDDHSISELILEGFGKNVDGEYVLHRVFIACGEDTDQSTRFACCPMTAGFKKACDAHLWTFARGLASEAVSSGCLIQDDYDLIDSLLPAED